MCSRLPSIFFQNLKIVNITVLRFCQEAVRVYRTASWRRGWSADEQSGAGGGAGGPADLTGALAEPFERRSLPLGLAGLQGDALSRLGAVPQLVGLGAVEAERHSEPLDARCAADATVHAVEPARGHVAVAERQAFVLQLPADLGRTALEASQRSALAAAEQLHRFFLREGLHLVITFRVVSSLHVLQASVIL